jgi:hypothetical protein
MPGGKLLVEVHTFDEVKRQGMASPAWHDEEYLHLLSDNGFTVLQRPDGHVWPVSDTFEGKLNAWLAEKK